MGDFYQTPSKEIAVSIQQPFLAGIYLKRPFRCQLAAFPLGEDGCPWALASLLMPTALRGALVLSAGLPTSDTELPGPKTRVSTQSFLSFSVLGSVDL